MLVLLILYCAVHLCRGCYDYGYRFFTESPVDEPPGEDVLVEVEDTSALQLGQQLEEKGLVRDGKLFVMQLELSAYRKSIKQGIYTLNTSMTAKEMMIVMSGKEKAGTGDVTAAAEGIKE